MDASRRSFLGGLGGVALASALPKALTPAQAAEGQRQKAEAPGSDMLDFRSIPPRILFSAHRGFRARAPENTMPAFVLGQACGADFLECDTALSRDNVPVVIHDDDFARTTNASKLYPGSQPPRICDLTFKEIRRLDAGSWFLRDDPFGALAEGLVDARTAKSFKGVQVPTLEETLDFAKKTAWPVNVEIKGHVGLPGESLIVGKVVSLIRKKGLERQVIVSSFETRHLVEMHDLAPEIPTGLLVKERPLDAVAMVRKFHAATYHPGNKYLTGCDMKALSEEKIPVYVWTVNSVQEAIGFAMQGVSGFFTDDPQKLIDAFPNRPKIEARPECCICKPKKA